MKKTIGILTIVLCLVITNMVSVFALDQPEKPDTINNETITEYNQQVDEYNKYVDTHNAKVDNDYEEAYSAYEEEKANVEANNQFVDNVEAKVDVDSSEARGFENNSTDEMPTDWNDETDENTLKTIQVEKSETPANKTIKVINIHVFLDENANVEINYDDLTPAFYNLLEDTAFELSDNLTSHAVLTEWETAEIDYDDTVTLSGESQQFAGNIVWVNGKRQWFGAAPMPYFFRSIKGYTQGYWMSGGSMFSSTATETEYGWSAGETYSARYAEKTVPSYYLYNGQLVSEDVVVRTTDKQEPKNIFALFTYLFTRLSAEPEKQALPEEPIKGEYLDKLDHLELISETIPSEEPTVIPETPVEHTKPQTKKPQAQIQTFAQAEDVAIAETTPPTATIEPADTPKSTPLGSWALLNLICVIITCVISIIMLFIKHRKEDNEDDSKEKSSKYKTVNKFVGVIIGLVSLLVFILTEDMSLSMVMVDKWTICMAIILIINAINAWFILRNKNKNEETAE